jgi:acyl dehydratase
LDTALPPTNFELSDPEILVKIKKIPSITALFSKVLFLSMVRPGTLDDDARISKVKIVFNGVKPDGQKIAKYKGVCGFASSVGADPPPGETFIPASYLQTLFIGLLGKFITTAHFPINPMGLIQVGQSFEQIRAVKTDEILDLSCQLQGITKTLKGIHTQFLLEISSDKEVVWQGISTFFTRSKHKQQKKKAKKKEAFLDIKEHIFVPGDTGRKYAGVSGDYNPHHLYGITAKMIGFKHPIAHGMWSLARVMASMEKDFGSHYPLKADATFKLPIFMPATITLGYAPAERTEENRSTETGTDKIGTNEIGTNEIKPDETRIDFELRDDKKGIPHLKGQFACALENE